MAFRGEQVAKDTCLMFPSSSMVFAFHCDQLSIVSDRQKLFSFMASDSSPS